MESDDSPDTDLQKHHSSGDALAVPENIAARVREERRILAQVLVTEFEASEPKEQKRDPEIALLFAGLALIATPIIGFLVYKNMIRDYAIFVIPAAIFALGVAAVLWIQDRIQNARERAAKALHGLAEALENHDVD